MEKAVKMLQAIHFYIALDCLAAGTQKLQIPVTVLETAILRISSASNYVAAIRCQRK